MRWVSAPDLYVECSSRNYKSADIKAMLAALDGEEVEGVDADKLAAEVNDVVAARDVLLALAGVPESP